MSMQYLTLLKRVNCQVPAALPLLAASLQLNIFCNGIHHMGHFDAAVIFDKVVGDFHTTSDGDISGGLIGVADDGEDFIGT